jgi:hypothetical protein
MPQIWTNREILNTIKEKANGNKSIEDLLKAILDWEWHTKGAYQYKDDYRRFIENNKSGRE